MVLEAVFCLGSLSHFVVLFRKSVYRGSEGQARDNNTQIIRMLGEGTQIMDTDKAQM